MKKRILRLFGIFAFVTVCFSKVIPRPPDADEIRGTWIGFTSEAVDFCRMVIRDGDGSFASSFAGGPPKLYRIDSWKLDLKGKLKMTLVGISTNAYPVVIDGKVTTSKILLQIHSPRNDWTHEVALYRERLIEDRMESLKRAMQATQ